MVLPIIPVIASITFLASSGTLIWYFKLSKEKREAANKAVIGFLNNNESNLSNDQLGALLVTISRSLYNEENLDDLPTYQYKNVLDLGAKILKGDHEQKGDHEPKEVSFKDALDFAKQMRLEDINLN